MTTITLYEKDDVVVLVTWTRSDTGAAKPLTGAVIETLARKKTDGTVVELTDAVVDSDAGQHSVELVGSDLSLGWWEVQINLTLSSDKQTSVFNVNVVDSIPTP